jgi:hypothetical protein
MKLGRVKEALRPTLEVPIAIMLINNDTTTRNKFFNVYYFSKMTKQVVIKIKIKKFP